MESSRKSSTATTVRPDEAIHNGVRRVDAGLGRTSPPLSAGLTNSVPVSRPVVVNGARGPTVDEDWSPPVIQHIRWLLAGIGAVAAVDAVTSQIAARHLASAADAFRAAGATNDFGTGSATTVGAAATVVVAVLLIGLLRPSKPARIAAITAMILLVLVQLVGIAATATMVTDALLPAWYVWTHYVVEAAMLVGAVVAGVKLSTEKANDYFSLRHLVGADDPRLWSTERYLAAARRR
jgi:hypothetical protein